MPAAAPASRPSPRRGETAVRILDAAEAQFARRGFAGTTLRDIAGAVGVREPSLYNHFAGKEALYRAVLERAFGPFFETLDALLEGGVTPAELVRLPEVMTEIVARHPAIAKLLVHEFAAGSADMSPVLDELLEPVIARAVAVLERGGGPAGGRDPETLLRVVAIHSVITGYFVSQPLFERLGGGDVLDPAVRRTQLGIVRRIARALQGAPPEPAA